MRVTARTIRNVIQNNLEITTWRPHNKRHPVKWDHNNNKYVYDGTRHAKFYVLPSERNNTAGLRDALNAIVKVVECRLYQTWVFGRTHKMRSGSKVNAIRVWRLSVVYTPQ